MIPRMCWMGVWNGHWVGRVVLKSCPKTVCEVNHTLYSLSNFEIRCDVTSRRLRISGKLPLNARVVYNELRQNTLYGYSSEIRNLPHVTSCLISKLDRE